MPRTAKEVSTDRPDFVSELRSETDTLSELQERMQEYMDNRVRLGWPIDPQMKQVSLYRQDQPVETLQSPTTISGEAVLSGFALDPSRSFR